MSVLPTTCVRARGWLDRQIDAPVDPNPIFGFWKLHFYKLWRPPYFSLRTKFRADSCQALKKIQRNYRDELWANQSGWGLSLSQAVSWSVLSVATRLDAANIMPRDTRVTPGLPALISLVGTREMKRCAFWCDGAALLFPSSQCSAFVLERGGVVPIYNSWNCKMTFPHSSPVRTSRRRPLSLLLFFQ